MKLFVDSPHFFDMSEYKRYPNHGKKNQKKYESIERKVASHKERKFKNQYYDMISSDKTLGKPRHERKDDNQYKKKGNPFKKYREEYLKKLDEKKKKQDEYQEKVKVMKLKAQERHRKSSLFQQKTKKGQPIMRNVINHYIEKLEKSSKEN